MTTRAATSSAGVRPAANRSALAITIAVQTSMQRLGPKRSIATPSGSCTAAKAKKNALDSTPISEAAMCISAATSGASTPIELRRNWLST